MLTRHAASSIPLEVAHILRRVLRHDALEVAPDTALDDLPGWDSLCHVATVVEAEYRFSIQVDPAVAETLWTVRDLIDVIQARMARRD